MNAREFTKAIDELISSPGQRLAGDLTSGYIYKGDLNMFNDKREWFERFLDRVASANRIYLERNYDPIHCELRCTFYEPDKKQFGNHWTFQLNNVPDIFSAAIRVAVDVNRRFGGDSLRGIGCVYSRYSIPKMKIEKVIFNDPATIVMWADGTKTVVKAVDEGFDPEKGLAMAISKKALGNEGNYYNTFRECLDEYYEEIECLYPKIDMVTASKNAAENFGKLKEAINKKFGVPGTVLNPEADK